MTPLARSVRQYLLAGSQPAGQIATAFAEPIETIYAALVELYSDDRAFIETMQHGPRKVALWAARTENT